MMNVKKTLRIAAVMMSAVMVLTSAGCTKKGGKTDSGLDEWLSFAELDDRYTSDELYEAALSEETLVVYSVSSRVFQAKNSFEDKYPGLSVEVKDIQSRDVLDMLKGNYRSGDYDCDVVICSDCDGSLYKELIEPGIIYTYVPWDIAPKMKEGCAGTELDFLGEAMMLFYNGDIFDESPVSNIWELTEDQYRGRIMMPSPLSSFSTYGFCAQTLTEDDALSAAYEEYIKEPLNVPQGETAATVFWQKLSANIRFVNSSDEVLEGVGNSKDIWFGIMLSSKLRYRSLGYHFEPITRLEPFAAVYTPNCIALAGGSQNINAAKLFIRFILGETDGQAQGAAAFSTDGSWSARTDIQDGSSIPISDIDMIMMDKSYLYENMDKITGFFSSLLQANINYD